MLHFKVTGVVSSRLSRCAHEMAQFETMSIAFAKQRMLLRPNASLIGGELFKGSYKEMKHIRDLFQVLYCSKQIPILMQCHPSPGGCKRFAHATREGSSDCRNSGATKLKSLLGLLSYNSQFLPNMATMLAHCISY